MGLDLKQVHEVLGTGAAASFMFGDRGQRMVDGDFDDVRSALTIFVKDMGLVSEAAAEVSQEVPLAASAAQVYQRGSELGWDRRDRKSTRLNSSHVASSYAVVCLNKEIEYC